MSFDALHEIWGDPTPPWTDEASSIRDGQQHQVLTVERSASHVIALIDFSPEMFPEGVEDTLKSIQIFCKELISIKAINKTAKRNGVGIWAFNTRERPKIEQPIEEESEDMVHPESMETDDQEDDDPEEERQGTTVHTLLPLTQPSLSVVRRLDSINIRELEHVYGHIDNNDDDSSHTGGVKNLKSAIFLAQDAFATAKCVRKPKPGEAQDAKEIWIFTAQDQPCESKEMLKDFQNFIKDHTREKRIELVVFGLKENFDYSLFYHRIRAQTPNRDLVLADQVWNRLNVIKKTRRAFGLPLLLPGWKERGQQGPNIMIDFFRLVQKAKPPSQKDVDIETGETVNKVTKKIQLPDNHILAKKGDDGQPNFDLTANRLRPYVNLANESVRMTEEDKVVIKRGANANKEMASLIILGFKHREAIPFYHMVDPPYLIYPNDDEVKGSRTAFAHLRASMMRKNVVAVGELLVRKTATSRMVAIFPTKGETIESEYGVIHRPDGMLVVVLPFEDDMRAIDEAKLAPTTKAYVPDEMLDATCRLIDKLSVDDRVLGIDYHNVEFCTFWNYVNKVAYGKPMVLGNDDEDFDREAVDDATFDEQWMTERAKDEIDTLRALLPEDVAKEKKRKASQPKKAPTPKVKMVPVDTTGIDWERLYFDDEVSTCKVPQLKEYLASVGLPKTGKKADLVARVEDHLKKNIQSKKIKTEATL